MKYCGIDLHSNNSVVVISDEADQVIVKRRCRNDLSKIASLLVPHQAELAGVVVESTYNWYWLVDGLMALGYEVKLANTVAMKRYDGLKHSGDEDDAAFLAQLLRLGILPTGYIHPPAERALRDLARKRIQLVRTRTQQVLSVENILARTSGSRASSNAIKRLSSERVDTLGLAGDVALAVQANLAIIEALNMQISQLERRLVQGATPRPEYALLRSIPGIGEVLAIVILLETGDISRFAQVGNFASYAVASTVRAPPTARRRVRETPRTATPTWCGPSSRRPTSHGASAPRPSVSSTRSGPEPTPWLLPRRWPTSWRGRATTS